MLVIDKMCSTSKKGEQWNSWKNKEKKRNRENEMSLDER